MKPLRPLALAALAACSTPLLVEDEVVESAGQALGACVAGPRPTSGLALERVFPTVTFELPVGLHQAPTDPARFYVVEKRGLVKVVTEAAGVVGTFADLRSTVNAQPNEAGLLGMALHPQFAQNGLVFFSYTRPSATSPANLRSVLARAKSLDGGASIDPATLVEILSFDQPYGNHNGGHIAFGPDGMLYAGFGDGGSANDPQGNGQRKTTLLGKVIRIDVDAPTYRIPPTNPFAGGGGRPEIYALGFRNPWRFSFDRATGDLWLGDVGQNQWEEVDKVVLGGNYGWKLREGSHCFSAPCTAPGLVDPVAEYSHAEGFSITGGYVYRGLALPELAGRYVYGDFGTGKVWALPTEGGASPSVLLESGKNIASFGEDAAGELYLLDYGAGQVHRLAPAPSSAGFPQKLSQTGCFLASDARVPSAKLVPYDLNAPLWSDGADKQRWLSVPAGRKIAVRPDGDWELPVGSVLVKTFSLGGKPVETRLFVRHTDGAWGGYSYEWNAAGTDATLLEAGKTKVVAGQTWTFPSRAQCFACHTAAAGGSLGLETAQLERALTYPDGITRSQLDHLEALGLFSAAAPLPPGPRAALPAPADLAAPLEGRARAYLHANCSFCHRPQGPGRGAADLRFDAPLADAQICDRSPEAGTLGVAGARLLAPGDPSRSLLSLRMRRTGAGRMPPIGSAVVDTAGAALVEQWIGSVTVCP